VIKKRAAQIISANFALVFVVTCIVAGSNATAFPELTRHSYSSCTACHVSPNGGGVLTAYGRNLSRDMLSTWGEKREGELLHGALPEKYMEQLADSNYRIGGDLRSIQTHRENKNVRAGRFFLMQAEVEGAYDAGPFAAVLSVGKVEDPLGTGNFTLVSQRFYGLARFGESANFRVGRFSTAFGLNLADHTISIRRPLGLGPEIERDNAEFSWLGEKDLAFVSYMQTVGSTPEMFRERAAVFRYDRVINERSRLGASFWQAEGGSPEVAGGTKFTRFMLAIHGIANLSEKWFLTGEIDRQERIDKKSAGDSLTSSQYAYLRLQYEPVQGILPLLQIQHERGDVSLNSSETNKYGVGINFFPRPHFELLGIWNKNVKQNEWSDEAYLLLHYYL
jgi:hypothetical protein